MCGFAGIVGKAAIEYPDAVSTALSRRGPDETGMWQESGVSLVASRLTHWEEGASRQPYVDQEGAAAVFNGELYNLDELRRYLGRPDGSEIEILVAGLDREGTRFLTRIDGQFAALVRPKTDGPVLAVRDRFGICPLYYCEFDGGVAVASDIEALMAAVGGRWSLSLPGLTSILEEWAPTGDLSPFNGIHQVVPGGALTIRNQRIETNERWAPRASGRYQLRDIASLESALRQSVEVRLRSTGRVACLLSGGIDSTVIGAFAAESGQRLGMGLFLDGDETVRARQEMVAEALGMELSQLRLLPSEVMRVFVDYVSTRRVPLVRLGPIGMTALAQFAREQGFRAVISGEGSDELLSGYDSYRVIAARAGLFGPVASLDWGRFGVPEFGAERSDTWMRAYWRGTIDLAGKTVTRRADILKPVADLFRQPLRDVLLQVHESPTMEDDPVVALESRRTQDLDNLLGSYLLTVQGDHAWMEEGVELRPPYLAAPVAQWALDQDPQTLISIDAGKLPVRQLLSRLSRGNPKLVDLNFEKAAFRVDASFLLRDGDAFGLLMHLISKCPDELVDTAGIYRRAERSRTAGRCSELESMVYLFAASLGLLSELGLANAAGGLSALHLQGWNKR